MNPEERLQGKVWTKSSSTSGSDMLKNLSHDINQLFTEFGLQQQQQQNWEGSSYQQPRARIGRLFSEYSRETGIPSSVDCLPNNQSMVHHAEDNIMRGAPDLSKSHGWDPSGILNNLSFLEQKIQQLRDLIHLIDGQRVKMGSQLNECQVQHEQLITADLSSIIVHLISTAGSLLPSVNQLGQFGGSMLPLRTNLDASGGLLNNLEDLSSETDLMGECRGEEPMYTAEEHESKDEDMADDVESLCPGSYEILQLKKEEILASHSHFCAICGKGFKRDANLRMHMRGHGDEYKTPEALAKPYKESSSEPVIMRRYSCPFLGCKRNKDHKKFQPLKTILCVKNHYRRTHCDKCYTCSRCHVKKFSILADLKTHEKHCGITKWLCSCGTKFSRKDKLLGHISLFHGHTPAITIDDSKPPAWSLDQGQGSEAVKKAEQKAVNVLHLDILGASGFQDVSGERERVNDRASCFSALNFGSSDLSELQEFSRPPCEDSESSFSFLLSRSSVYSPKTSNYF